MSPAFNLKTDESASCNRVLPQLLQGVCFMLLIVVIPVLGKFGQFCHCVY